MANRIKGITVEIGGDTTGLDKALKSVNSSIKTTQSSLRDVNRLLEARPEEHRAPLAEAEAPQRRHRPDEGKAGLPKDRAGAGEAAA